MSKGIDALKHKKVSTRSRFKETRDECDKLWAECVKVRAGYRSELSGKVERLVSHHLRGKQSIRLRYEIFNGFCCTQGEHMFGFHNAGRKTAFERRVMAQRGKDIFERLEKMQWDICKTSIYDVKIYLEQKLKELKHE